MAWKQGPDEVSWAAGAGPPLNLLVVNKDPELRIFLEKALYVAGLPATTAPNPDEAITCLHTETFSALVLGLDSPETVEFMQQIVCELPNLPVVALARTATPEFVREVLKSGVAEFFFGPTDVREFGPTLVSSVEQWRAQRSRFVETSKPGRTGDATGDVPSDLAPAATRRAEPPPKAESGVGSVEIICRNKRLARVLEIAERIAPTESSVLIQGESGTGKELIAKRIHELSHRKERPFVEVNCGALPENLLESQLFGHEKGSFTGAMQRQMGLFELADGGSLFLDEVGETSLDMQVKLLRVLQFKEFRRVGSREAIKVDVRVIAATNRDLKDEVEKCNFRPDLYYRLNVIPLEVPPLRERLDEIPDLVRFFCERLANDRGLPRKTFSDDAIQCLQKYRWTGNVRELENAVERLILLAPGDCVQASDLEEYVDGSLEPLTDSPFLPTLTLDDVKRMHIGNVLRQTGGNKMKSARILKINVKTLYNLMKNLKIQC